jgi:signal transduction histidine kinase
VSANASTLRTIVQDLLDLAGLESGHINLSHAPLDLAELVGDAVAQLSPAAEAAGVRLSVELPGELPFGGDRVRLRQALDNLLSNAVKYSPGGGGVRVRLATVDSVIELSVADEGLGIPMGERDKLFSRFFRGATAHERGIPGTGLGLSLTRLIVELHGGTISLTDSDGPGSTFIIRLPLTPPSDA